MLFAAAMAGGGLVLVGRRCSSILFAKVRITSFDVCAARCSGLFVAGRFDARELYVRVFLPVSGMPLFLVGPL